MAVGVPCRAPAALHLHLSYCACKGQFLLYFNTYLNVYQVYLQNVSLYIKIVCYKFNNIRQRVAAILLP